MLEMNSGHDDSDHNYEESLRSTIEEQLCTEKCVTQSQKTGKLQNCMMNTMLWTTAVCQPG